MPGQGQGLLLMLTNTFWTGMGMDCEPSDHTARTGTLHLFPPLLTSTPCPSVPSSVRTSDLQRRYSRNIGCLGHCAHHSRGGHSLCGPSSPHSVGSCVWSAWVLLGLRMHTAVDTAHSQGPVICAQDPADLTKPHSHTVTSIASHNVVAVH